MTASLVPTPVAPPVLGRRTRERPALLAFIFLAVFLPHAASRVTTPFDSRWSVPTALSIIKEGNTDLDEFKDLLAANDYYEIKTVDGHYYSYFPIGASLMAVPFVYVLDAALGPLLERFPGLERYIRSRSRKPLPELTIITLSPWVELGIASFIVAATAVVIFLLGRAFLDRRSSLLLVFVFAFCTPAWSTASRALWQHGPTMLMLATALYLLVRAKERPWISQFASLPLAFSYLIRPTNSISILLFTLLVLQKHRRYFVRYCLWALAVGIPFVLFNLTVYHSMLPPYYHPARIGPSLQFPEALLGNLVSPARGMFVFSPILVFSIAGATGKVRRGEFDALDGAAACIVVLHWIAVSGFVPWWQGHAYGSRYMSDMVPYAIYFLIPCLATAGGSPGLRRWVGRTLFAGLIAISFVIHWRGATAWCGYSWNVHPVNIDDAPSRAWDWRDAQFVRGVVCRDASTAPPGRDPGGVSGGPPPSGGPGGLRERGAERSS